MSSCDKRGNGGEEKNRLTVTTALPAEEAGFTEAPRLPPPVRRHASVSTFAAQQGVGQDLQAEQPQFSATETAEENRRRHLLLCFL